MAIMIRIIGIVNITLVLLLSVAFCDERIGERSPDAVLHAQGIGIPPALKYEGAIAKRTPFLYGRALIDSLFRPRQLTCDNPGWQVCSCMSPQ